MFEHRFSDGMGPWVPRHVAQDTPTGDDCGRVNNQGRLVLRVRRNPLRVGHVWVPPDVFQFTTGYLEARVKFGAPPGSHGAVWAQGVETYATPKDYEVDVAEHFGVPVGRRDRVHAGLWHRRSSEVPELEQPFHVATPVDTTEWHTYGCDMQPDSFIWTIDGREVADTRQHYATRPKFLILSMLVDQWERPQLDLARLDEHKMRVQWVRVS
jgi:beta-glucanase (GH16 family)